MYPRRGQPRNDIPVERVFTNLPETPPATVSELVERRVQLEGKFKTEYEARVLWFSQNPGASQEVVYSKKSERMLHDFKFLFDDLKLKTDIAREKLKLKKMTADERREEEKRIDEVEKKEELELKSRQETAEQRLKYDNAQAEYEQHRAEQEREYSQTQVEQEREYSQKRTELVLEYEQKRSALDRRLKRRKITARTHRRNLQGVGAKEAKDLLDLTSQHEEKMLELKYEQKRRELDSRLQFKKITPRDYQKDQLELTSEHMARELERKLEQKRAELYIKLRFKEVTRHDSQTEVLKLQLQFKEIISRLRRFQWQVIDDDERREGRQLTSKEEEERMFEEMKRKSVQAREAWKVKWSRELADHEEQGKQTRAEPARECELKTPPAEEVQCKLQDPEASQQEQALKLVSQQRDEEEHHFGRPFDDAVDGPCECYRMEEEVSVDLPELVRFVECLRNDCLVKSVVSLHGRSVSAVELSLPAGVRLAGDATLDHLHGRLLVRQCYKNLTDLIFEKARVGEFEENTPFRHKYFVVQGNPGIGKSLFTYYLLYRLMDLQKTIVWQPARCNRRILITPESIEFGEGLFAFDEQLDVDTTWFIVDVDRHQYANANTVLVSSLRGDRIKNFRKFGAIMWFMPVWSWEEMELAQRLGLASSSKTGEQVSPEEVAERFRVWGGIPRYVFEWSHDERFSTERLESAIRSASTFKELCDLPRILFKWIHSHAITLKVAHLTAVTEEGPRRYALFKVLFASPHVQQLVVEEFVERREAAMMEFLLTSTYITACVPVRGAVFEGLAHRLLKKGGKFQVRRLAKQGERPAAVTEIELQPSTEKLFGELDEVTVQQDKFYYRSKGNTLPGINSLLLPDRLFVITVRKDHPVTRKAIEDAAKRLLALQAEEDAKLSPSKTTHNSPCVIRLYFVVPCILFDDHWHQQDYVDDKGETTSDIDEHVLRVELYTLGVRLEYVKS